MERFCGFYTRRCLYAFFTVENPLRQIASDFVGRRTFIHPPFL
jgi:hypothetical protein